MLPAGGPATLPGAQDAKPAEQGARSTWPEFKARAAACYQAASPALARLLRDDIAATYGKDLPSAVACLNDDFEACIAHLRFPLGHRRAIRTTNLLERLFGEARRRTKVIPHAFGERAVLKLMYAALIRAAERWRGIRITEFEQRQLKAIREELNNDFTARTSHVRNNRYRIPNPFIQQGSDLTTMPSASPSALTTISSIIVRIIRLRVAGVAPGLFPAAPRRHRGQASSHARPR